MRPWMIIGGIACWLLYGIAYGQPVEREPSLEIQQSLILLERSPQAGPTFDKVYQHYANNGGLDMLADGYRQRVAAQAEDLSAWLVLSLIEAKQGHDKEAAELLDKTVDGVLTAVKRIGGINNDRLLELTRRLAARNDVKSLRRLYDGYLDARAKLYSASTDPAAALNVRRNDLSQVATNATQVGDVPLLLEYLGRLCDLPDAEGDANYPPATIPMMMLAWQLPTLPAAERYTMLRDWTLPADERKTLRFLAACTSGEQIPQLFWPARAKEWGIPPGAGLVSNLTLLLSAAIEAGQLDDLAKRIEPLARQDLPHADCLEVLTLLVAQHPAARLKTLRYLNAATDRIQHPPPAEQRRTAAAQAARWDDMHVLAAALMQPKFFDAAYKFGGHVLNDNRRTYHGERITHTGRILALATALELPAPDRIPLLMPGLKHFSPGTPPLQSGNTLPPAWWSASGDCISHITGFDYDSLFFNYPVTGTFEFSFETHSYDFSQAEVGYGGLISIPEFWNNRVEVMPVSRHETITRGRAVEAKDWWNTYSVRVSPEAIKFYSNGHLVYEETEPSVTSPWLHFVVNDHRRATMRRPTLTGSPEIPRDVRLVDANRLEGWNPGLFSQQLANRLTLREQQILPAAAAAQPANRRPPDWYAVDGVIYGRQDPNAYWGQSRLQYHRPLLRGEHLTYEFLYEPNRTGVHPALGRLAFLLEPDGVRVHWMTTGFSVADPFALTNDNAFEESKCRRGPEKLPLKAGDWNKVVLALKDAVVQLQLNGELIYERQMEPQIDLRFAFYHDRNHTTAQIRNVVLSGDWPGKLDDNLLANLLEPRTPPSPALAKARHAVAREEELADDVLHVWRTAKAMQPRDRHEYLKAWVLPAADHPTYRLQADFTPIDPPLPAAREEIRKLKGPRRHLGGELTSPAIELVRTAAELKELDALEADVRTKVRGTKEGARNLLALQTLIAIAREDDQAAQTSLQLLSAQCQTLDPTTPLVDRYPEFVVAFAAADRPALRKGAQDLAELLVTRQQSNYVTNDWERKVRWLKARNHWLADPATAKLPLGEPTSKSAQWHTVAHPTSEHRGKGWPAATWQVERGKAAFHTGQAADSLYFQSPLTGNFEVNCRRTTNGWREIRLQYAAVAWDVNHDGLALWRVPLQRGWTRIDFPGKVEKWGSTCDFRLKVQDGVQTIAINGKEMYSETLPEHPDPWLSIQAHAGHYTGSVENLQITGAPKIPDSVLITAAPDLLPWRSDYYGDTIDAADALWTRQGHEIIGNVLPNAPGSQHESVLHYHRPLTEDGEIEYEFFYEQGKTEVHPALDRAAFLLSPDGVKVHYLTDGAFERNGVEPDNAEPLKGAAAELDLREGAWNHIKLAIKGDNLTLILNGKQIGSYTIEPTNQRLFGLFRYSDATAARVRIVKHRGDWPKKLPEVKSQVLAQP